jgi:TRAP-type C4-dicarboxylate transport system permease small subunit
MSMIRSAASRLVALCNILAAGIVLVVFAVLTLQVVSRYGFNTSFFWADEVALWGLAWLVMLACIGLCQDWKHIYVPAVLIALPGRLRDPLIILSRTVTLGFLLLLAWYGYDVVANGFHRVAPGLGLSTRWVKLAIPACALLSALVLIVRVAEDVAAWRRGDRRHFDHYGADASVD